MPQINTPKLYLNENIDVRLVALLSNLGIEAIHTLRVNNGGANDESQLQYAAENGYILVTHNRRHFRTLHKKWRRESKFHPGILIMGEAKPEYLATRINKFIENDYFNLTPPFCVSPPR